MSHLKRLASIQGQFLAGVNQITEIDVSTLTPPATGDWKVVITQGATINEYIISHTNNDVEADLLDFINAEGNNIFNDTNFLVTFTGVLNSGKLIFEGADTLTSAVFTTVDISSNVVTSVLDRYFAQPGGQPQISDLIYFNGIPPHVATATVRIITTAGGTLDYVLPINTNIDVALQNFVTARAASILSVHNVIVTYNGVDPSIPLSASDNGVLRFTGNSNDLSFQAKTLSIVGNVTASFNQEQLNIPSPTRQVTRITLSTLTPPISGSWKIIFTQGAVVTEFIVNHTTGIAWQDVRNFASANYTSMRNSVGFYPSGGGGTNSAAIYLVAVSNSISAVITTQVISGNADLLEADLQLSIPDSSTSIQSYSTKRLIYGEQTTQGDFLILRDNKDAVIRVETDDFSDIINNEFTNDIIVTQSNSTVFYIDADKIVSLTEDGTGSVIEYNLFGSTIRRFKVIENVAFLESSIEAL